MNKKCFNCKKEEPYGLWVKQKGKRVWWCDTCYEGYLIDKQDKLCVKEIKNQHQNK